MARIQINVPDWLDKICAWPVLVYRKQKYGCPFRRIPLGEGKYTIVDPPDFYRFNVFNWCLLEKKSNSYAVRIKGHPQKIFEVVSLHREILNNPKGFLVDHKNSSGLDNRSANLRPATFAQNACNTRKRKNTSTPYIGASLRKKTGRFDANISVNGKKFYLGSFPSALDAARAYDAAARKYHGQFAKFNFPKEIERSEVLLQNGVPLGAQSPWDGVPEGGPMRLNLRNAVESRFTGRLANWLGAKLNFPENNQKSKLKTLT